MLEIKPIQSKTEQERLCGLCGVAYDADALAYSAHESGVFLGICQFRITGDEVRVYTIREAPGRRDLEALILLGRAALSFAEQCGVKSAELLDVAEDVAAACGGSGKCQVASDK